MLAAQWERLPETPAVGSHHFPHPAGGLRLSDLDQFKGWLAGAGLKITEESSTALATFITTEKTR